MIIKAENLAFQYQSVDILKDVSFSIAAGGITAILGPNGVGKTTLLKCINKILIPQKGHLLIKGQELQKMSGQQIAQEVGYVAQKNSATKITVFDAVLMGRHPHIRYKTTQRDLEKVDSVMKHLNLGHMRLQHLDQLSGGQLQKVAIARALVQETDLILLDEPTSSLDLKNQMQILDLLRKVVKSHNIAAVMTMHDLNAALRYADHFICLKDHKVFAAGKINEICPEIISDVYGVEVEIINHNGSLIVVPLADTKIA